MISFNLAWTTEILARLRRGQGRELRFLTFSISGAVRRRFLAHSQAVWRFADPM
jgi:hypothetical protein